jgi:hypothetical protein
MTVRKGGDAVLAAELAGGTAVADAARAAGMSEATAYRRLRDDGFKRQVDEARGEILTRAVARLTSASVKAVETLEGLLTDDMAFARLSAARAILELGCKLREQTELAARLDALERELTAGR